MSAPQERTELQRRSVVSSFLFSVASQGGLKVALFKRSGKVHTYPHHLAPISGSIEQQESPIAAAWREINEETGLTPQDIELWRQGQPYSFSDPSVGRLWTIHPFAFRLKGRNKGGGGEEAITIDWEHEAWKWYDPKDVVDDETFGGVPRLADSLRRVYFEMFMNGNVSSVLQSGLQLLKTDHSSGSHELTTIAVKAFRDVLTHLKDDPNWWETIRIAAWHLWKNGRESMGSATLNAFLGILADMDNIRDRNSADQWDRILTMVDDHLKRRRETASHIKESFTNYLLSNFLSNIQAREKDKLTLLTLSASSTIRDSILDAFNALPVSHLDLRILESRPLFEGATMASSLLSAFEAKFQPDSGQHLELSIYTDAAAAQAAKDVDFVLLGADRISSSGSVSNKTGSLPAVLSIKHISPDAKVLVFSGLEKVAEPGEGNYHQPEENDPLEVSNAWISTDIKGAKMLQNVTQAPEKKESNCCIAVRNVYFEWVDASMVDAFITEQGTLAATDIHDKAIDVKQKRDKYFGSL